MPCTPGTVAAAATRLPVDMTVFMQFVDPDFLNLDTLSDVYDVFMSFSERNAPPRRPAGLKIPQGVRAALLRWFEQQSIANPTRLWATLSQKEGYGSFADVATDILERFGKDDAEGFSTAMKEHWARDQSRVAARSGVDYDAEPALRAIPDALFLDVLEYGIAAIGPGRVETVEEINRLFSKHGIYYQFDYAGHAAWHGDPGAYTAVLQPAMTVLVDLRLLGCESEFSAAIHHLRSGTMKDREDAIEEAGKSVESAMKVVLLERGVTLAGKETAQPLVEKLVQQGIAIPQADRALLSAARIRNEFGGHGTGAKIRNIPQGVPELAVHVAASTIIYLAGLLP